MTFAPFDPLEFKSTKVNDAALAAIKREIENILSSYVGWYDPFCELIQNALDAVEARIELEKAAGTEAKYKPRVIVRIDLDENALTVTDNGIGLDQEKFQQFLAPNFSFKSGNTRGHKGVGATYVAYGFNYMRVSTRTPGFEASGRISNARDWLKSRTSGNNPKIEPDTSPQIDSAFDDNDRGVSITVRFDEKSHPKKLSWIQAKSADVWMKVLSIKTGVGSVTPNEKIEVTVKVRCEKVETNIAAIGTKYFWLHESASKKATFKELTKAAEAAFKKAGPTGKLPDKFNNLDFIYETWTSSELRDLLASSLDEEDVEILDRHPPQVSVEFGYTARLWPQFNEGLNLRPNYRVLTSGIQLAANNMPQGDPIQIPLNRNIGRQN